MKCPNCGRYLSFKKVKCDDCGQDLRMYKRAYSASNQYYNDGLNKAKVRDLSGAVVSLQKSLQLEKKNTNARNLLGLIYYEMGEVVSALSEWVISKHFDPKDNEADGYMEILQSNPARLDNLNQTMKKYNQALTLARQGSDDLAIIQLKKVVASNPNYLRAMHLLALLYLKTEEPEQAYKVLLNAQRIDVTNTVTLSYLKEAKERIEEKMPPEARTAATVSRESVKKHIDKDEETFFEPVTSYKEDKPNVFVFVNLILGIIIGVAVGYFLIVPTVMKKNQTDYTQKINDSSAQLASSESKISTLEREKEDLQGEVDGYLKKIEQLEGVVHDETLYDDLFKAAGAFIDGDDREAATILLGVDITSLERQQAKDLYNTIKDATFTQVSEDLFIEGNDLYNQVLTEGEGKYGDVIKLFQQSLELNPENVDSIYFMGRCYDRMGKVKKAKEYYTKVIDDFPDSDRSSEAEDRLNYLNQ